jgi:hypothetical protein
MKPWKQKLIAVLLLLAGITAFAFLEVGYQELKAKYLTPKQSES